MSDDDQEAHEEAPAANNRQLVALAVIEGIIAVALTFLSVVGTIYHVRAQKGELRAGGGSGRHTSSGAAKNQKQAVSIHVEGADTPGQQGPDEEMSRQWRQDLRSLPFHVSLRLAATLVVFLHCVLEVLESSGALQLPLAFFLASDNLQLFASFLIRVFLLSRSLSFAGSATQRGRGLRAGLALLLALYVKSAVLMNRSYEMEEDDVEYPSGILFMLAAENIVFDLGMTALTAYWLVLVGRGITAPERRSQDRAVRLLLRVNVYNVVCMVGCLVLSRTAFREHEAQMIVVVNGGLFACSMWLAEGYFFFRWWFPPRKALGASQRNISAKAGQYRSSSISSKVQGSSISKERCSSISGA